MTRTGSVQYQDQEEPGAVSSLHVSPGMMKQGKRVYIMIHHEPAMCLSHPGEESLDSCTLFRVNVLRYKVVKLPELRNALKHK
jgi:hypothetical protein